MRKHPRVVFNTWNGAFFNPGGGEVQLENSKTYLEKSGVEIILYDLWCPQRNVDILHQFSMERGVEHVIKSYKDIGKKVALSTIFWATLDKSSDHYNHVESLLRISDILMTNSKSESEKLSQDFGISIEKFSETRNSITEEFLNKETKKSFRDEYGIEGDFILSLANIDTRKNTKLLVQACKELNLQLVTIGHIRDMPYYEEFKGSYSNYIHIGPLNDVELIKSAYQQCLCYALPSICETPGIAALEAASQGAKVVITCEGSTRDYFSDLATYVNPYDLESIKSGLEAELDNKRSSSLEEHVKGNFTWDKTADDILEGYQKIL